MRLLRGSRGRGCPSAVGELLGEINAACGRGLTRRWWWKTRSFVLLKAGVAPSDATARHTGAQLGDGKGHVGHACLIPRRVAPSRAEARVLQPCPSTGISLSSSPPRTRTASASRLSLFSTSPSRTLSSTNYGRRPTGAAARTAVRIACMICLPSR